MKDKLLIPEVVLKHTDKEFNLRPKRENSFVIEMILGEFDLS